MAKPPRPLKPMPPAQTQGVCGYADLLIGYATGGPQGLASMAALIGYQPVPWRAKKEPSKLRPPFVLGASPTPRTPTLVEGPLAPLPFWQPIERVRFQAAPAPPPQPPPPPPPQPPDWGEPALAADLTPWNALLPRLRADATTWVPGKTADQAALLRLIAKGVLLDTLPRRRRRRWGPAVQIISDRAERLTPFYEDQTRVEERLNSLFPNHGRERATAFDGAGDLVLTDARGAPSAYRLPPPGTLVVVLGDLGCLAGNPDRLVARWISFGQRLAAAGCRAVAVTPCPRSRWYAGLARWWTKVEWERAVPSPSDPVELARRANRLLTLVSPAIRLEPALLRDIRRRLGVAADAGTEADLWQHRALVGRSGVAATLDPMTATERRAAFQGEDPALISDVLTILRRHRVRLSKTIWLEELLRLDPKVLPAALREQDLPWAQHWLFDLVPTLASLEDGPGWARRVFRRESPYTIEAGDERMRAALSRMYIEAYPDNDSRPPAPPGFDPALITRHGLPSRDIKLHQIGRDLAFLPPSDAAGSPLTDITSVNGIISITGTDLPDPRTSFWPGGIAPSWASGWGNDEFGAWASFSIAGVTQRLRWIEPGKFLMGSPDDEPGRDDDEGPVREVTISKGFWLFDTPCTQALWQAVMGDNPSRFNFPDRPVEQLSWNDAEEFIGRINGMVPGLSLSLPTEAQWEYACRAGTQTALYTGPIGIDGNSNAPALDAVAWYYGNSKDETHAVGLKAPNGWGLYDMLGNVWEWCADGMRRYSPVPEADPVGPSVSVAFRALRGGSWYDAVRHVRAACRYWLHPDGRYGNIGFRCARGQGEAELSFPHSPRLAERQGAAGMTAERPGAAVVEVGTSVARVPLPAAPALIIRSDCEEVHLTQITRPDWASAIGRDRFGLWTRIDIEGVTQRLRWIAPGRFLMGSPDDEPGRNNDEGPMHEVTISQGFWLFDTPCTQALWQAVIGNNSSRFPSPDRPVEQVSWNGAQEFIGRINTIVPSLSLTLPTEAQWEFACRAGTQMALYTGPIEVDKDGIAPALDPIAWYGGNCVQGFESADGFDISDWPERQFPDSKVGTHPVGQKAPNGWGLHDMLGNVWEWCADGQRTYDGSPKVDPIGPTAVGANPALRGGSWRNVARAVRVAYRRWLHPDVQYDFVGFRCARGQGGAVSGENARPEEAQKIATVGE